MDDNYDCRIFIKELNQLIDDYQNCSDLTIKEVIYSDIQLLSDAIELTVN
jgi:hypothetical protein